jgi:hypothetical protein
MISSALATDLPASPGQAEKRFFDRSCYRVVKFRLSIFSAIALFDRAHSREAQRLLLASVLRVTGSLFLNVCAFADVQITITFTQVNHNISPDVPDKKSFRTRVITLTSDRKLEITSTNNNVSTTNEVVLGEPKSAKSRRVVDYVFRTRIARGAIILGSFFESYSIVTKITTNGIDICTATRDYKLNPGRRFFQDTPLLNRGTIEIHAENIKCAISSVEKR